MFRISIILLFLCLPGVLEASPQTADELAAESSELDSMLAKVRELVSTGKKTEAASLLREFKQRMAVHKLSLVVHARFREKKDIEVGTKVFKENVYLSVSLGDDSLVYNSLRLDQLSRARKILNEEIIPLMRQFAVETQDADFAFGIAIEWNIPYRDFSKDDELPYFDYLRVYAPRGALKNFVEYAITSQDLVDASVVLINGNRIALSLQ